MKEKFLNTHWIIPLFESLSIDRKILLYWSTSPGRSMVVCEWLLCCHVNGCKKFKSRELKQRRLRLVKNEFKFYQRNVQLSRSVQYTNDSEAVLQLYMQWQRSILNGNTKKIKPSSFALLRLRTTWVFTFLFCRGQQRNVQRFITHVHSYCFAHGLLTLLSVQQAIIRDCTDLVRGGEGGSSIWTFWGWIAGVLSTKTVLYNLVPKRGGGGGGERSRERGCFHWHFVIMHMHLNYLLHLFSQGSNSLYIRPHFSSLERLSVECRKTDT